MDVVIYSQPVVFLVCMSIDEKNRIYLNVCSSCACTSAGGRVCWVRRQAYVRRKYRSSSWPEPNKDVAAAVVDEPCICLLYGMSYNWR